nr:MAG: replication-associated protein [Cressdnaviricota sp.]
MSYRNWVFTINNWSEDDIESIEKWNVKYVIYGKEVGESGTPHLQGYVELDKVGRFSAVKKLHGTAHWEQRLGTQEEAIAYCMKDGDFVERGTRKRAGTRTDLDRVRQMAVESGMRAVSATGNMQQIRVAEKYLTYNEEPRDWETEVIWIYGPTGSGKSRLARELTHVDDVYTKNDGSKWWDGYDNHEDVIIDDFRDSWWSITEMLSLLDRYEKRVEYKGGYRQFRPKKIIITSAVKPERCYAGTGEAINQLLRRIKEIKKM